LNRPGKTAPVFSCLRGGAVGHPGQITGHSMQLFVTYGYTGEIHSKSFLRILLSVSDVVFVLAVPTPRNWHMVSRELMERLRPDAILTLVSRAHLVDFDAMTELVSNGRFRAAIDVFPREPLEGDHLGRTAPGTVLSAHRAGAIPEALQEIGRMVVDDLEALLAGESPARMQYATPEMIAGIRGSAQADS